MTDRRAWFEVSEDGWRETSARRPLARLLLEAVQNAFDAAAEEVSVEIGEGSIVVEDDAKGGVGDGRLVYTIFLTDKAGDPKRRGRLGRGLKELIAAMDSATVETVGMTIRFGPEGRVETPSQRTQGTRLVLRRALTAEEREESKELVRRCIPPKGTMLRVGNTVVRRPRRLLVLPSCELETVAQRDGIERATSRIAQIALYTVPKGSEGYIFEMGIPVCAWNVPFHVDVAQRLPTDERRERVPERFELALKAFLLESLIHRYLDASDLRADWIHDVISRFPVRSSVLDAYVSRAFPRGAVLGGASEANDRARQLGAHVIDAAAISHGAYVALSRVVETAEVYVARRSAELEGQEVEPDAVQLRFAHTVTWLGRHVAGRSVKVKFFARSPTESGLLEDAKADPHGRVLFFNTRGPLHFDDPLEPYTLGVILHELAHLETLEHDHRFVERLQWLAGQAASLLAEGGIALATKLREGAPP